jgi:hypothetical protein
LLPVLAIVLDQGLVRHLAPADTLLERGVASDGRGLDRLAAVAEQARRGFRPRRARAAVPSRSHGLHLTLIAGDAIADASFAPPS